MRKFIEEFESNEIFKKGSASMIQLPKELDNQLSDETLRHRYRVAFLADAFARYLEYPQSLCNLMFEGGLFHDIGKEKISDNLLYKTDPLTPEEFQQIKQHVVLATEVEPFESFSVEVKFMILQHHEKFDGTGYPLGLKGDEIHPFAQIIAICDVFDALTSPRSYHQARSKQETLNFIKERSGTHFNADLVEDFLTFANQMPHSLFQELKKT